MLRNRQAQDQPFLAIELELAGGSKIKVIIGRSFATLLFGNLLTGLSVALIALGAPAVLTTLMKLLRFLPL